MRRELGSAVAQTVEAILDRHGREPHNLVAILLDCRAALSAVPREAVEAIATGLGLEPVAIQGLMSRYSSLSAAPPGRHAIRVCRGTSCHLEGGEDLLEAVERELKTGRGQVSPDGRYSLETPPCTGCCALAPVVTVGADVLGNVSVADIHGIVDRLGSREDGHA